MIYFQTMETALKIAWVNRILQNCHSSWKILIEHFFRQIWRSFFPAELQIHV